MRYATGYHAPVLCKAVVEGLVTDPDGVYVDATLGGGGHTAALLDVLAPGGRVIGLDRDPAALAAVRARLPAEIERGRLHLVEGNFAELEALLAEGGQGPVDGVLADLGVSSHQFDTPERGFSFRTEGPLDMRMNPHTGYTASDVVNAWEEQALRRVLRVYGEEPRAAHIARAIVAARPLATTTALADVVRRVTPARDEVKTLARVFQAIRIAVNGELEALERLLAGAARVLRPGGRLAVISYHSLEDRRVKRMLRYGNLEGRPVRDLYGNLLSPWRELTRHPVLPGDAERAANPRARSARLRLAERRPEAPPTGSP
ncbi:MAG: ribosomal RNA small subunit methyltransferase H [Rhodothermaceae bacterium]|nr:MAG: ribosomal RNA small subunit methyltransferase H [Rhodothermaceae bacterium]